MPPFTAAPVLLKCQQAGEVGVCVWRVGKLLTHTVLRLSGGSGSQTTILARVVMKLSPCRKRPRTRRQKALGCSLSLLPLQLFPCSHVSAYPLAPMGVVAGTPLDSSLLYPALRKQRKRSQVHPCAPDPGRHRVCKPGREHPQCSLPLSWSRGMGFSCQPDFFPSPGARKDRKVCRVAWCWTEILGFGAYEPLGR